MLVRLSFGPEWRREGDSNPRRPWGEHAFQACGCTYVTYPSMSIYVA